jgi:hypothetical protein
MLPAGLSSSQHVDWATTTRERFRAWSNPALQLLLTWLQQNQQQQQQLQAKLLACLTAWVRLGCLHQVPLQLAEQVAQAGLVGVQSSNEQVRAAGVVRCWLHALSAGCYVMRLRVAQADAARVTSLWLAGDCCVLKGHVFQLAFGMRATF